MEVVANHGYIPSVDIASPELALLLASGGVAVSTGFAKRFDLYPPSQLELDTPRGTTSFPIVGLFEDFGGSSGGILLDLGTFDSHWVRRGASSAMLWARKDRDRTVEAVRASVGNSQDLFFVSGA